MNGYWGVTADDVMNCRIAGAQSAPLQPEELVAEDAGLKAAYPEFLVIAE